MPASPENAPRDPLPRPVRVRGVFRNPGFHPNRGWLDVLRWKLGGGGPRWPRHVACELRAAPPAPPNGIAVTFVGHATFLVRCRDFALLTDPVWSGRVGPFGIGPRRVCPPAIAFDSLPPLHAVALSHDHYDHCDLSTLRRLARAHPRARLLTPPGFSDIAPRAGFPRERHLELDWWQSASLGSHITATATPARHWGNRLSGRRNQRLWCGWRLDLAGASLHFAGDTAWDDTMFRAIRAELGAVDLALIPIGAYAPRWFMADQHCDPEEAVKIHLALGARRSLGMHWGAFAFTDEARDEPAERLAAALKKAGLPAETFAPAAPSETVELA